MDVNENTRVPFITQLKDKVRRPSGGRAALSFPFILIPSARQGARMKPFGSAQKTCNLRSAASVNACNCLREQRRLEVLRCTEDFYVNPPVKIL